MSLMIGDTQGKSWAHRWREGANAAQPEGLPVPEEAEPQEP